MQSKERLDIATSIFEEAARHSQEYANNEFGTSLGEAALNNKRTFDDLAKLLRWLDSDEGLSELFYSLETEVPDKVKGHYHLDSF